MLSSASFGSLLLSVGLAIGLVGALLILLARRAGSSKVIYVLLLLQKISYILHQKYYKLLHFRWA